MTLELRPKNLKIQIDNHTSRKPKNSIDLLNMMTMEQSKTTQTSTTNTDQVLSDSETRKSLPFEKSKPKHISNIKISRIKNLISESAEIANLRDQPVKFAKKLLHKNSRIQSKVVTIPEKESLLRPLRMKNYQSNSKYTALKEPQTIDIEKMDFQESV